MKNAAILDVGICPNENRVIIAAKDSIEPDAGIFLEGHIAQNCCIIRNPVIATARKPGCHALKRI
jgi:hypothetical protein